MQTLKWIKHVEKLLDHKQNFFQQYHLRLKKAKEVGNILDLAPRFAAPAPKTAETGEPVKNLHGVLVMWGPTLVNQDRGKCNIAIEDPPIWC